jgi:hypothetical protein
MTEFYYAPIYGFLAFLAAGWRLPMVVEPMQCHHGAHAILLWRLA